MQRMSKYYIFYLFLSYVNLMILKDRGGCHMHNISNKRTARYGSRKKEEVGSVSKSVAENQREEARLSPDEGAY